MRLNTIIILLLVFSINTIAQDRLKPGAVYQQGEKIFAPMVGYRAVVPEGWFGTLPQGEEFFLMIPAGNRNGYMFVRGLQQPISEIATIWQSEFRLTDDISIKIKGAPEIQGNKLKADFDVVGAKEPSFGHAEAIDGGFGWTIVMILLSPNDMLETYKNNFAQLMASSQLEEPSIGTIYGDLNWAEYLKGKYLMSHVEAAGYRELDELWLCPDGTFRAKIKSKGRLVTEKSPYRGNNKGTWKAEGVGEKGKLILTTTKGATETLDMEIKEDKIFINGGRFFALEYNDCK